MTASLSIEQERIMALLKAQGGSINTADTPVKGRAVAGLIRRGLVERDGLELSITLESQAVAPPAPDDLTKVIFRWFNGDVIALFPELPAVYEQPWLCDSFMHMGQHGAADCMMVIHHSRPATEAEYAPVRAELERDPYHYRLSIRKRESSVMRRKRFAEAERLRNFKPTT